MTAAIDQATVLEEMQVDEYTSALLKSMHEGSWFTFGNSPSKLVVDKGGRQGCRYGGLVFNLAYGKLQRKFREIACLRGIVLRLRVRYSWDDISEASNEGDSEAVVFDVAFVDDNAAMIFASVPATLYKRTVMLMNVINETFAEFGMKVNWSPGKTEVMMTFRGKKAKAHKLLLENETPQKNSEYRQRGNE